MKLGTPARKAPHRVVWPNPLKPVGRSPLEIEMDEVRDEFASYGGIVSGQEIKKIAMAQLARKEAAARDARLRRLAGL